MSEGQNGNFRNTGPFRILSCILAILLLPAYVTAATAPEITSITPDGGPLAGGTIVTITGSGFSGTSTVSFGGASGRDLAVFGDSKITVVTPPHEADTVTISITNSAGIGNSTGPSTRFSYEEYPVPRLSEISPSSGPMAGGTLVTITGSGFSSTESVRFGGRNAFDLKILDDNHVTVRTPASPPGPAQVTMTNAHGAGRPADQPVIYNVEYPVPVLKGISPDSGSLLGGTVVTITGSGFSGANDVRFGRVSATDLNIVSDSMVIATAPPNAAGTVAVSVVNPAHTGSSTGAATVFRYDIPLPRLVGISPSTGSFEGGTVVTLIGSGFTGTTNVSFGGKPGTGLAVIDDSRITVIAPASGLGSFPISIKNAYGEGGSLGPATLFRYTLPPATITATETAVPAMMTSMVQTATPATIPPATRSTPGFEAIVGISALGAIILLRGRTP